MSTFAAHQPDDAEKHRPPKVITVPPEAFSWEWPERPEQPVEMGLRIVPDEDIQAARDESARFVFARYGDRWNTPEAVDCFNDALLRHRIARTTCQPDDQRKPWFRAAEDTVRMALSTEGVKLLAFEIEVFDLETSPLYKPISDDELLDLAAILESDAPFVGMSEAEQRGTRRLLVVVLDRIGAGRARVADTDEAADDDETTQE
jgi:hypothetical protein